MENNKTKIALTHSKELARLTGENDNKNRNEYGVNLMDGPVILNPRKRQLDAERRAEHAEVTASKKARLDNLLGEMKNYSHMIESAMKPPKEEASSKFTTTPTYVNGEMRSYQIHGLNWLIALYEQGLSGILGDEMGLGKTLQTISLIGYLQFVKKVNGRFLVIVPLTTFKNLQNEFKQWCPALKVVPVHGNASVRLKILHTELKKPYDWDVCLTTYETCKQKFSKHAFITIRWHHVILDEGTRIKNEKTAMANVVGLCKSKYRLILTGTPLNNYLHELWALLSYLMPKVFDSSKDFDYWFDDQACLDNQQTVVENLHTILKPLLLRRLKIEVEKDIKPKKEINLYVDITDRQREWYRKVLKKEIQVITGDGSIKMAQLQALFMQLRKCTNHPYLFPGAEPGPPYVNGDHIVNNSGKMIVLDKLLTKLRQQKSRVLIFSQFTRVLDIIEDYLYLHPDYEYCRLDGRVKIDARTTSIDEFQNPKSKKFIFLLSTRAGGMGINLTGADSVIIYDSDWNPQMDLQAIARAHRIGQTKEVRVYRIIARNTVDEKIIERANMKLKLDDIVIQSQVTTGSCIPVKYKESLLNAVRFGAESILSNDVQYNGAVRDKLIQDNVQKMIDQVFDSKIN